MMFAECSNSQKAMWAIRLRGQGADKQLHPKKSIPCACQADDTLKPLFTTALGNQYVQILHILPKMPKPVARTAIVNGKFSVFHFGTHSH